MTASGHDYLVKASVSGFIGRLATPRHDTRRIKVLGNLRSPPGIPQGIRSIQRVDELTLILRKLTEATVNTIPATSISLNNNNVVAEYQRNYPNPTRGKAAIRDDYN